MTSISGEVISRIRSLKDNHRICIVGMTYMDIPGGGCHLHPQVARLRIVKGDNSRIEQLVVEREKTSATISLVKPSYGSNNLIEMFVERPRGYQVLLLVDLNATERVNQLCQVARDRKQAERNKAWHPMWYLHQVLG